MDEYYDKNYYKKLQNHELYELCCEATNSLSEPNQIAFNELLERFSHYANPYLTGEEE